MTLRLPEYEQVVFGETALEEVICQLRFHQILRIAGSPPAEFQELIRKDFPVFTVEHGAVLGLGGSRPLFAATAEPAWQFKTVDDKWTVSLTSNFLALKTVAYEHFADFLRRLTPVVQALEKVYDPPFYVRVGLRYVNRFVQERVSDQRVRWEELLNQHLAGTYADPVLQDGVVEANHHLVLQTDRGQIGWRYSRDIGEADENPAERFMLDFDHFVVGQVAPREIPDLLSYSNETLYRLFRWCLTEKGYQALKPKPTGEGAP